MMTSLLLIVHLIAIASGTGMSLSNVVNLRLAAAETGERARALANLRRVLARIGDIVIAVIWISGLALWWMLPEGSGLNGWFLAKMALVIILTLAHGLARLTAGRIMRSGDATLMPRLRAAVTGVWLSAMAAIACAVLAFSA